MGSLFIALRRAILKAAAWVKADDGVTLVEYALLLSLISVVCVVSVKLVGQHASTLLSTAAASL